MRISPSSTGTQKGERGRCVLFSSDASAYHTDSLCSHYQCEGKGRGTCGCANHSTYIQKPSIIMKALPPYENPLFLLPVVDEREHSMGKIRQWKKKKKCWKELSTSRSLKVFPWSHGMVQQIEEPVVNPSN